MSDLAVYGIAIALAAGLLFAAIWLARKYEPLWRIVGIPRRWPKECPRCGQSLPAMRMPRSVRQALVGGWTCRQCSAEITKWGEIRNG
ncbi:hypothetical protein [Alteriqipengyuania sp. 357]